MTDHNWHSQTQKRMTTLDDDALRYVIKDCHEAAEAGKDFNPKVGQYLDEAHYASMELAKRQKSH